MRKRTPFVGIYQLSVVSRGIGGALVFSNLIISQRHNCCYCIIIDAFAMACNMLIDQRDKLDLGSNDFDCFVDRNASNCSVKVCRGENRDVYCDGRMCQEWKPLVIE